MKIGRESAFDYEDDPIDNKAKKKTTQNKPKKNDTSLNNKGSINNEKPGKKKKSNNKSSNEIKPWLKPQPAGTEAIIPMSVFSHLPECFRTNVMIIAMKKKLDIFEIIDECENIMKNDKNANPPEDGETYFFPKLEFSLVFLSLLAEKLECKVADLFDEDLNKHKEFVYGLIDEIGEEVYDFEIDNESPKRIEIYLRDFDVYYEMTSKFRVIPNMSLTFYKDIFDDGTISYAVSFGDLGVGYREMGYKSKFDYMIKGAYLWEEEEGKLKEYVEKIIRLHQDCLVELTEVDELVILDDDDNSYNQLASNTDSIQNDTIEKELDEYVNKKTKRNKKTKIKARTAVKERPRIKLVQFDGKMSSLLKSRTSPMYIRIKVGEESKYLSVAFDKDKKEVYIASDTYNKYKKYFKGKVDFVKKI